MAIPRAEQERHSDGAAISFMEPNLGQEEIDELAAAIREGWVANGPRVARLEVALRAYLGVEHLTCLSSCTAGLALALHLLDVGPGDEVLLPTLTYVACANVVEHRGARPVFVDSEPDTGLVDLDHAAALVGPRTRAAIVVHLGGRPLDMEAVSEFHARTGVPVVEDAAHAVGASWHGRSVGSWGNLTSFSFHASKNMTTFDGGALVVDTREREERVSRLARQGVSRASWERHEDDAPGIYDVIEPGFKFAMNDASAAVGVHQLRRLDDSIARRAEIAALYDELLVDLPLQCPPSLPAHARHVHHVYAVQVRHPTVSRNDLARALNARRIGTSVHFRALHLHTYYRERRGVGARQLPHASALSDRLLSLPLHPGMDDAAVHAVAGAMGDVLR
jgi:dTDP-4-amino-4,6-dideoxygalactose transaminase